MPISSRSAFPHWSTKASVTDRTAVYGPVRTVVWQGSADDRRPYADHIEVPANYEPARISCSDLFLKHFGRGVKLASREHNRL